MGGPMAANLIRSKKHEVSVFDIDLEKAAELAALGGVPVTSLADTISTADVVMTSLPGPKQISEVAFSDEGIFSNLKPNGIWIDLSTNNLETCNQITAHAKDSSHRFIDAPVSGGDEGAKAGSLTILVGGAEPDFEYCLPVLQIIGEKIDHVGANGAGYSAKIAQVILCYLHSLALSEALMLGIKGGVDAEKMLSIIQNSTGKSYVANRYGPPILNGDYDPSFTLGLALKDMKLAEEMARNLHIDLPMCDLTTQTYAEAVNQYGFNANHLKAVRLLEEKNDTFLRK